MTDWYLNSSAGLSLPSEHKLGWVDVQAVVQQEYEVLYDVNKCIISFIEIIYKCLISIRMLDAVRAM